MRKQPAYFAVADELDYRERRYARAIENPDLWDVEAELAALQAAYQASL